MIARFKKNSYQWSPLAVMLIIILSCVSLLDAKRTRASETSAAKPSEIVVRRVWADAEDPYFMGAPSADGKYLSYVDWESGDLAIRELATGKNRRLTNEGWEKGRHTYSIFSPDSKYVACRWRGKDSGGLRIIGLDGSERRFIKHPEGITILRPTNWSTDGKHILALGGAMWDDSVDAFKFSKILFVSVEDGDARVLKTIEHLPDRLRSGRFRMSLSPDDRYVAYSFPPADNSGKGDIWVFGTDGGPEIQLVEHPANDFVLGWAPDGNRIVFASDRTGIMGIWAIDVSDGKAQGAPQLLKSEIDQFHPMGFSQDGSYYYGTFSGGSNVYTATFDPEKGDLSAKPVIAVRRYEGSNWAPDWSPNGRYLACLSSGPGEAPRLVIQSMETGEVREITPELKEFNVHSLRWSADGRSLLGSGSPTNLPWGALQIDVKTGEVTTIAQGPAFAPESAPDGKAFFYVRNVRDGGQIVRHDPATGEEKELYSAPGIISKSALSPDGREFAFFESGALKVLPATGGEPRELAKVEDIATIAWTRDGRYLLYGEASGDKTTELWRIAAEGGEPQKLGLAMRRLGHLRFHPDGRRVTFCANPQGEKSEVWVMENFLPQREKASEVVTRLVWPIGADLGGGKPSPDGRYLTFVDANTGDVGLRELATGKSRLLTHEGSRWESGHAKRAFWPLISPNGQHVVYTWSSNDRGWHLRVVGMDGSEPRTMYPREETHSGEEAIYPLVVGWLPDSKHVLAYQTKRSSNKSIQNQVLLIPLADGPVRVLKTLSEEPAQSRPKRPYTMSLSPDGRYLAYSRELVEDPSSRDIFLLPMDGKEETALVTHPADDYVLGWAPDGQRLLFAGQRNGSWDAWGVRVVDGKPQGSPELVRPNIGLVRPIGVTRNGSFYYVLHFPGGLAVHTATLDWETGRVVTPPVPVEERALGASGEPTWSPDGKFLAYWSNDGVSQASVKINILSMETDKVRQLDPNHNWIGSFRWSPDGRSFVAAAQPELGDPFGVFQIDARTGDAKTLVEPGEGAGRPAWSPDGKGVFFVKGTGIVFRDLQTGNDKEILPPDRSGFNSVPVLMIDVSPDGQQVAVYGRETESKAMVLKVIPASGGESRELLRLEKESPIRQPLAWTPDGQSLLLIRGGSEETRGLWRIPINGGKRQRLELPWIGSLMDLSVHPDGRRIAFVVDRRRKEELWVMENFLPTTVASAAK